MGFFLSSFFRLNCLRSILKQLFFVPGVRFEVGRSISLLQSYILVRPWRNFPEEAKDTKLSIDTTRMAPSDITKFLSPAAGNSLAASLTSLSRRQPSAASSPPPQSTLSAAASFISRKLSLNRRKPASQDPISTFESTFDAEVKRARLSSTFGVASSASSPSPSTPEASDFDANENLSAAMNGHRSLELRFGPASSGPMSSKPNKSPPVASLCNLGNTCYMNSVLYTLRFTPGFLHSLHHMVHDLGLNGSGGKSSSKRSNGLAAQQGQTNGSTNSIADAETELVHDVIDQVRVEKLNFIS